VEYLNALGAAYLQAGELSEAEKTLRRALHLQPIFPKGLFYLGRFLRRARGLRMLKERTSAHTPPAADSPRSTSPWHGCIASSGALIWQ
jgi:tetratricopeptide (TPR) repeat protein